MSESHEAGDETVLVIMIILLIAACFSILKEKIATHLNFDLPFTVCMFGLGLIVGGIMAAVPAFGDSVTMTGISPKLIFDIFLPVLIFDGSQGLKLRTLGRVAWPAFWLAGPGLLIHTGLVSLFMWIFTDHQWSWFSRLLFGAILSATDPVAVIAVLKDLDADNTVTTLIDGEAIANDGTAIILFAVFYPGAAGHADELGEWSFYILLIWLVLGSPIVGTIFAYILTFLLKQCYNQPIVEATLTLAGSYVAFIVAETYIRVSGVLVLATLGYHLASNRGARLSRHSELATHAWEVIVYFANSVIFALVGLIVGKEAIPAAEAFDWLVLFLLYLALHVFRAALVGGFWPLLGDITFPRYVLLVVGALRGGVALALALVVHRDEEIEERVRNQVLFYTGGVVLLSIIVNGSVSKVIVTGMGLNKQPGHKLYMKQRIEASLRYKAQEAVRHLQGDHEHDSEGVNWLEVYDKTIRQFHDDHLDTTQQKADEEAEKRSGGKKKESKDGNSPVDGEEGSPLGSATASRSGSPNSRVAPNFKVGHDGVEEDADTDADEANNSEDERVSNNSGIVVTTTTTAKKKSDSKSKSKETPVFTGKKVRTLTEAEFTVISLRTMKSKLWRLREGDMVSVEAFELLLALLDEHLDTATFVGPHEVHLAITAQRKKCRLPLDLCGITTSPDVIYFESLLTFLDLVECSNKALQAMMPQKKRQAAMRTEDPKVLLHSMIHSFAHDHPEVARGVRTNRMILHALTHVKESLHNMHEEEGLPASQYKALHDRIISLTHSTAQRNVLTIQSSTERMVFSQCILFGNSSQGSQVQAATQNAPRLGDDGSDDVPELVRLAFANSERRVFAAGDHIPLEGLGVVLSGSVEKKEVISNYHYYPSDVFGLVQLLSGTNPSAYHAGEACVVAFIPLAVVLMLINGESSLLESMWARYGVREAEVSLSQYYPYCTFKRNDLRRIAANGVIRAFAEPHRIEPGNRSIFLLHGTDATGTYSHRSVRLLPPLKTITFQKYAILFVIENYSLNVGGAALKSVGVPLIDAASIHYFKLLSSLEEANSAGADVGDNTLSLLIDYCKVMGSSLFYLIDHKGNPGHNALAIEDGDDESNGDDEEKRPVRSPLLRHQRKLSDIPMAMHHTDPFATASNKKSPNKKGHSEATTTTRRVALNPEANLASRFAVQLAMNMSLPAASAGDPRCTQYLKGGGSNQSSRPVSPAQRNAPGQLPIAGSAAADANDDEELADLETTQTFTHEEGGAKASHTSFVPLANQEHRYNTGTPEPQQQRKDDHSYLPGGGGGSEPSTTGNPESNYESAFSAPEPLDVEELIEEWRIFTKMVRRMILERFHLRLEGGKEMLSNLLWWWKVLKDRQPQLAAYFGDHPGYREIHSIHDLCTEDEVMTHWQYFGFAFDPENTRTRLSEENVAALLAEITVKAPPSLSRHGSALTAKPVPEGH